MLAGSDGLTGLTSHNHEGCVVIQMELYDIYHHIIIEYISFRIFYMSSSSYQKKILLRKWRMLNADNTLINIYFLKKSTLLSDELITFKKSIDF